MSDQLSRSIPGWTHVYSGKVRDMYLYALLSWLAGTFSHFLLEKPLCRALPVWFHRVFVPKTDA